MPIAAGLHYYLHEGGKPGTPPIVLIHGAGGDHLCWPPEIRHLPGRRVIAVDLPGHGKSTGLGCQSVDGYCPGITKLLDETSISKAVFIGHAMGGAVALSLALDHPERVAGIGLISCGSRLPIASSVLEDAANSATFTRAVRSIIDLMQVSPSSPGLENHTLKQLSGIRQSLLLGDLRASARFDVSNRLEMIHTRVLVICGTEDQFTPRHFSESLANRIPGAALQTVNGMGHLVMLEHPRRVTALLKLFISTIPVTIGI
jgi:pimeloyl-ACP methyl ester carboxylesterase